MGDATVQSGPAGCAMVIGWCRVRFAWLLVLDGALAGRRYAS